MRRIKLFSSFFQKIFVLLSSTILILVLFSEYLILKSQEQSLVNVMYSKAITIAKAITLVTSDAMVTNDNSFIVEHLQKVIEDNDVIKYAIVTKAQDEDEIILVTQENWSLLSSLPLNIKKTHSETINSEKIKSRIINEKVFHVSFPVVFTGIKWGWIDIGYSLDEYNNDLDFLYKSMLIILIVVLGISFLYSFFISKWIVNPILLINKAAHNVSIGKLDTKVEINSQDELGQLSNSFNHMTNTLRLSDEKLRKSNEELEIRVQERTHELNQLNHDLDKKIQEEVSKQSQQEKMLIQQSRFAAMGEMIGNIAHQWRQPLNAMGLVIQNLELAYEMEMIDEKYINRVITKSNRLLGSMSQTIDDFRNFFKPNKKVEVFSIKSSIDISIDIIKNTLENNMINIIENIDEKLTIKGFPSEFSQVILNLLGNAKDALVENNDSSNREIIINVSKEGKDVLVKISDNAGGIPLNIIDDIFDPYFTTKEEGKGTGIGLYMSKMIIENNMDGSLLAKNENNGASFLIKMKINEEIL
ncbi:HAMP domain-containing sensor histidine kinase [Arcobacter peruensis]|uniref:HAMP domain-containing sensor histidine kinase n=1 Tax=Arcobacter peruensis TaxID=2320140 RepID=UPI000F096C1B|nr:ATP-binding protein [Arcobacter peruensis]